MEGMTIAKLSDKSNVRRAFVVRLVQMSFDAGLKSRGVLLSRGANNGVIGALEGIKYQSWVNKVPKIDVDRCKLQAASGASQRCFLIQLA